MEIIFFKNTNLLDEKNQKRRFARQKVLKKTNLQDKCPKRQICMTLQGFRIYMSARKSCLPFTPEL